MKKLLFCTLLAAASISTVCTVSSFAVNSQLPVSPQTSPCGWYEVSPENYPGVRWWWHGSAVDKEGLEFNMEEFAAKGIRSVEITPIYGVKGNESNDIPFLSDKWMEMLRTVEALGDSLGVRIDMNNGTGWPFGGPNVTTEESARKLVADTFTMTKGDKRKLLPADKNQQDIAKLQRVMAYTCDGVADITGAVNAGGILELPDGIDEATVYTIWSGRTLQKVKRAAPGGEGLVLNHLDSTYVKKYLSRFDEAFTRTATPWPASFFNDSYEVYGADWDDRLLDNFLSDHGYKLEDHIDVFLSKSPSDFRSRLFRDYRTTLARMLEENFTLPWLRWANSKGATVRNQSHGSPANILDLYADVDIPECESFGQSDFEIPGLASSGPSRQSDSEPAVLKFASSAANLAGKPYTSAETLTWLTEHFRTSLARCKPELDMMFSSGVNRVFFHGAAYSPAGAAFPGRHFYAAIDMSPTNSLWQHSGNLFDYVARVQSFLTKGEADNDFLLYFPFEDILHNVDDRHYLMFDIHRMDKTMPAVKQAVRDITAEGYDLDYVSDRLLQRIVKDNDGTLRSLDGTSGYKAIIIPGAKYMPIATLKKLVDLADAGAKVIVAGRFPESLPGNVAEPTPEEFRRLVEELKGNALFAPDVKEAAHLSGAWPEVLREVPGMSLLRRKADIPGKIYFIANNGDKRFDGSTFLSCNAKTVLLFDPLTGKSGRAISDNKGKGRTSVRLVLEPGQSMLVKAIEDETDAKPWLYTSPCGERIALNGKWTMRFMESDPEIKNSFRLDSLKSWTELPHDAASVNSGTALYTLEFKRPENKEATEWILDLGDVREVAKVRINGHDAGTAWSVPYRLEVGRFLKKGKNRLEIEVTSLDANRIADWERRGVEWRIFKDANIASVTGAKEFSFGDWETVPAGLTSPVTLTPATQFAVSR